MSSEPMDYASVHRAVRQRRTFKVLGDPAAQVQLDPSIANQENQTVLECIADAAMAPFHYDRKLNGMPEPFRFHVIWADDCRKISERFRQWFTDVKPNNKLPAMLSACGCLVLVTWLPDSELDESKEKAIQINEEHLAAASAATQNLLVLLTSHGFGTYWSSGGQFRMREMFDKLGIDHAERLLSAVFVEYPQTHAVDMERAPGKHRANRSPIERLMRVVSID